MDDLAEFESIVAKDPKGKKALSATEIEVVKEDMWMYVSPTSKDELDVEFWNPMYSGDKDVIVVGHTHLADSPEMLLYLDILHELCHIAQRHRGLHLWNTEVEYVDSPTELEAYQFVIDLAKKLGATTPFLKEYLKVEWVSDEDYERLLKKLGVD